MTDFNPNSQNPNDQNQNPNGDNYGQSGQSGQSGQPGQTDGSGNANPKQPEYGQYAPGAGPQGQQGQWGPGQQQPQYGQYGQYGQYTGANAGQYAGPAQNPYGYGQPQAGQNGNPYANPYANQNNTTYGNTGNTGNAGGAGNAGNPFVGQGGQNQGGQNPFGWHSTDPFKLIESMLPQRTKNWVRTIYAIIGVAAIVLGIALLIWPGITLQVAAVLLGIYFVVSGVTRVVTAIVELGLPGGWRILDILVGVLLAIGGIVVLKNSALSGQTLAVLVTMTVGLGWMLEGFMALVESWRLPSSGWAVLYAVISIIAGFVVLLSPITSTMWLVVFGGCALVVMGVSAIVRGFKFGR